MARNELDQAAPGEENVNPSDSSQNRSHVDPDKIQELLQGILPVDEARSIELHLNACAACRAKVNAFVSACEESITVTRTLSSPPSPFAPLPTGTRVDHFVVERLIGRGGMGEIYLARDDTLGRRVALKLISPTFLGSHATRKRFLLEARTTARFNHPHIVSIYAVGEHAGRPYMALEYLEGQTLREYMATSVPGAADAIRFGLPIARALAEAHKHGVLHRDLKPGNIMLPSDGRLRVLDFGIAKGLDTSDLSPDARLEEIRITATGLQSLAGRDTTSVRTRFLGTPAYMAPEQWRGEPVGPATDMWAFGLILYQMVTGRRPYHGVPLQHIVDAVAGPDPVPPVAGLAEGLPKDLAALIDQCLSKNPAERPSAAEAAARLEVLQDAQPHGALRSDPGVRSQPPLSRSKTPGTNKTSGCVRPPRGRWWRIAFLVAGALLVAVVAGIAFRPGTHQEMPAPAGPPIQVGLYPASPTTDASRELAPLLRYLESRLNRPVSVVIAPSYRALREGLEASRYDFGLLPPLQYVLSRYERPDLVPVAYAEYDSASQGLLVVPVESEVQTVKDLQGKRICYVDRGSTSGYLMPRLYLREQGLDPDTLFSHTVFSGAHVQAIADLLADRCDVAAVYSEAYLRASHVDDRFLRKVRILVVTRTIPSDVLCAAPETPPALVSAMRTALLAFHARDVLGTAAVSPVYPYTITDFVPHTDSRFRAVEAAARLEGILPRTRRSRGNPGGDAAPGPYPEAEGAPAPEYRRQADLETE